MPHTTSAKIFLEAGVSKPYVKVNSTSIYTITSLNTIRSLKIEHVGYGTTEAVYNRLTTKVVVVVTREVKVCLIPKSTKFLNSNTYRNLPLGLDVNLFTNSLLTYTLREASYLVLALNLGSIALKIFTYLGRKLHFALK
jgi:hypothetical protein